MFSQDTNMYTAKQIATRFNLSVQHVYYLRDRGVFAPIEGSIPQKFTEESVEAYSRGRETHVLEERVAELERVLPSLLEEVETVLTDLQERYAALEKSVAALDEERRALSERIASLKRNP